MLAVIKIFQIEKFLWDFVFSIISSLNISAFYMWVPYKVVPYKKSVYLFLSCIFCLLLFCRDFIINILLDFLSDQHSKQIL